MRRRPLKERIDRMLKVSVIFLFAVACVGFVGLYMAANTWPVPRERISELVDRMPTNQVQSLFGVPSRVDHSGDWTVWGYQRFYSLRIPEIRFRRGEFYDVTWKKKWMENE